MMNTERVIEKLREKADKYQEPFGLSPEFVGSPSYAIATALRELAYIFEVESNAQSL